jgi:hypothetical protein
MRTVLEPPNQLLNFVHVADEPIDIVREIGIFFDRNERRAFLRSLREHRGADRSADARRVIADLERRHPAHDLNATASLERRAASLAPGAKSRLAEALAKDERLKWSTIEALLGPPGEGPARWDFIAIASRLVEFERDVPLDVTPSMMFEGWQRRC